MARGNAPLDWAAGEALAFASLVAEGHRVRLSGQDSERGTFSHRHAVFHDTEDGHEHVPLAELAAAHGGVFDVHNSPLSEAGVLGFEYGYSVDTPDGLVIWEAQFGDFVNGAQVIIDQFLSSAEEKWGRLSGLVMLLPHGFEGAGPEHSSARLERFLQLCAEDNMQVVYPTTPAQFFHLLRRQVLRPIRKPLVVMSPKSLLRHPRAVSALDEFTSGSFQRVIPDREVDPAGVRRVLMTSGKLYYELLAAREERGASDVAIVRLEQLYPLRQEEVDAALAPYPAATHELLDAVARTSDLALPLRSLEQDSVRVTAQLTEQVEDSAEIQHVVHQLEQQYDEELERYRNAHPKAMLPGEQDMPTGDEIGEEFERFLATLDEQDNGPDLPDDDE